MKTHAGRPARRAPAPARPLAGSVRAHVQIALTSYSAQLSRHEGRVPSALAAHLALVHHNARLALEKRCLHSRCVPFVNDLALAVQADAEHDVADAKAKDGYVAACHGGVLLVVQRAKERVAQHQQRAVDGEEDCLRVEPQPSVDSLDLQHGAGAHAGGEGYDARRPRDLRQFRESLQSKVREACGPSRAPRGQDHLRHSWVLEALHGFLLDLGAVHCLEQLANSNRPQYDGQHAQGRGPHGDTLKLVDGKDLHVLVGTHGGG
mmetsp:Transcript_34149/g.106563  ORF Transcript_34149/g.106563 Transcript_34149/m.106563 type:complete len:263 (+) Transcript_34149:225-1013(+)